MQRFILSSVTFIITILFIGCSGSDDNNDEAESNSDCIVCELMTEDSSITIINEWCDNGDGTYDLTVTVGGQTNTDTFDFAGDQTIEDLAALDEERGAVCNN